MDASQFAGSDFLKAADLGNTTPTISVAKVEQVDFQDGGNSKLCLHPSDPNIKPIVLNVTNTRACIAAWGTETQDWIGKQAMLSVRQTQMGPGIGVTPINPAPGANPHQVNTNDPAVPFDDKIPY